jgi:cation transport ATPase
MRQRGIDLPSREYEARYAAQGRDILYLASSGRLEALFVVGYYPDKNIISSLRKLERSGIDVSIVTPDPNITPSMLADKMGEDRSRIEIEGADLTDRGRAAACAGEDTGLVFSGSIASCEAAVTACRRLNGAFHVFTAVGIVQAVFAGALTAYCAFAAGMTLLTPVAALEFQAIMSLPVFLVSLFRKN